MKRQKFTTTNHVLTFKASVRSTHKKYKNAFHHLLLKQMQLSRISENNETKCLLCDISFSSRYNLNKHFKTKTHMAKEKFATAEEVV
jgi:hypothetical protein